MQPPVPLLDNNILVTGEFTAEKTSDIYKSVVFSYGDKVWQGVIPKYLEKQGVSFSDEELSERLPAFYEALDPEKRQEWVVQSDANWKNRDQTYEVLNALYSGEWECRVHGPVPKVNPQPSARIQSLKKKGYVIGSQRRRCEQCDQTTMHDILVMLPFFDARFEHGNELRKPMSESFKAKTKKILGYKEACFNVKRAPVELIIDHKFPSQRWGIPESDNPNDMSEADIRQKFQLLSNQTNLWKSRYCDRCVRENIRGDFMGITWFYQGDENWASSDKYDENGCVGCPWYDMERWKQELIKALNT